MTNVPAKSRYGVQRIADRIRGVLPLSCLIAGGVGGLVVFAATTSLATEQPALLPADSAAYIWHDIKHAIVVTEGGGDKAEAISQITALFDLTSTRRSQNSPSVSGSNLTVLRGRAKHYPAEISLSYSTLDRTPEGPRVSLDVELSHGANNPARCVGYNDIKADLAAVGWTSQLNRDHGVDGLNMPTGTIVLASGHLLGFVHFEMPPNGAEPYCLSSVSVANYDLGLPSWARTLLR